MKVKGKLTNNAAPRAISTPDGSRLVRKGRAFEGEFFMTKSLKARIDAGALDYVGEEVAEAEASDDDQTGGSEQQSDGLSDRARLMQSVLGDLTQNGYSDDGVPHVKAINSVLPAEADPFTADERDAVWAELLAQN